MNLEEAVYHMNPALLAGGLVAVVLLAAFVYVLRSLAMPRVAAAPATPRALPEVRVGRYRPMVRLLSSDDVAFLQTQAGYTPKLGQKLMRERRRLMRAYLRALSADFRAIYAAANDLLLSAPTDQPELAAELTRQRILFAKGMAIAHCNLCLNYFGLGEVNVSSLVDSLCLLERRFNSLADAAAARSFS
jgi:hypothetical protein